MPWLQRFARTLIIGAALAALAALAVVSGCGAVRLAYGNAPTLSWWWLDGYMDFTREQAPPVRDAIGRWFEWHRGTQLPELAALLVTAQADITQATTPEAACTWFERARTQFDPAIDRALQEAATVLPLLTEAQFRHLEQRHAKANDELRRDFLQPDAAERQRASARRAVERFERVYGRLDAAQRALVADSVAASPFDPALWVAERQRRQQDTVQVLRRLREQRADADERLAALRALAQRTARSPDAAYRAYQQRLSAHNCAFAARLHNATTPAQRERALDTLKGWEGDLRALATAGNGA